MANIEFDFNKEVAQAYNDFPQLCEDTGFIDLSDPSRIILRAGQNGKAARRLRRKLKRIGSCKAKVKSQTGEIFNLVAFHPKRRLKVLSGDACKFRTLDHEIGHCLISGDGPIFNENAADAFAAIRSLQRFGNIEDLILLSAARSYNLMTIADGEHLSSPMLNQIIKDSEHIDFKSLSFEETIQKAKDYADKFTPTEETFSVFNGLRGSIISSWFLGKKWTIKHNARRAFRRGARKNSPLATEVGASLIRPFLSPEGAVFKGKLIKFSPKEQEKLQKRLQKSLAASN